MNFRRKFGFKGYACLILILITSLFLYLNNFCDQNENLKNLELILESRDQQLRNKNEDNHKLKTLTLEQERKIKQLEHDFENLSAVSGKFSAKAAASVQKNSKNINSKVSNHKLAVIVPFRDRFDELLIFVPHMNKFLTNQLGPNNFQIFIINQADMFRFNRASLINVGYYLALENECDYMVMHDVDLLPNNGEISYEFPDEKNPEQNSKYTYNTMETSSTDKATTSVYHLSSPEYHPKYHYSKYIGGVLLMTLKTFELLNGLSNNYWGWGREDDELYTRLSKNKISVKRQTGLSTGYDTYIHIHDDLDERRQRDYKRSSTQKDAQWVADKTGGYKTLKYKIKSKQNLNLSTLELIDESFPLGDCFIYNIELECDFKVTPWCVTDEKMQKAVEMKRAQEERVKNGGPVNWVYKGNEKVKVVKGD